MVPLQHELFSSFQVVNLSRFALVNLNRFQVVSLDRFRVVNFIGFCNMYGNTFSYDANGNILTQNRSDENGQEFEALNYKYRTLAGNLRQNRLYHVNDNISYTSLKIDDIDDQGHFANGASSSPLIDSVGQFNNYSYDNIGNLVKDKAEQISNIEWTVYGKVKKITRVSGSTRDNIIFDYDPMGNRIAKHVYDNANSWKYTTYYVRDAQGNIMGAYEHKNIPPPGGIGSPSMSFVLQEQHIYGSSRLGMNTPNKELIATPNLLNNLTHTIGKKYFEITNHLGSVTTVISDRKIPIGTGTVIAYYQSDIISSTDFAVFGAPLSARDFSSSKYNFGFQEQEKVNEISGKGNHYTAKYWEYDTRLGIRWNLDPVVKPWQSGYSCLSNNPIWKVDPNGDDDYYNYAGKYVGSDNAKTTNIRLVTSKQAFEAYQKQGIETLQGKTRIVTVQENADQAINDIYTNSVNNKIEQKAYIILDTKNATLGIEVQPQSPNDKVNESENVWNERSRGGDKYNSPVGDDGNKVIVGQIHGHPGKELGRNVIPGPSKGDVQAAKDLGAPIYPVDKESIYKVDQSGNMPDASCKDECAPILQDALETSGGKPK